MKVPLCINQIYSKCYFIENTNLDEVLRHFLNRQNRFLWTRRSHQTGKWYVATSDDDTQITKLDDLKNAILSIGNKQQTFKMFRYYLVIQKRALPTYLPTYDLPTYDLPTYDIPTYDLPTYDLPTYDLLTESIGKGLGILPS